MLSIVITHKNRINNLKKCVKCLLEQKTNYEYEIIIVDGGSSDNNDIRFLYNLNKNEKIKVYFFNDKNFNVSKYRNYGAKNGKGSIVTFLDVDMLVGNDFVDIICEKYRNIDNFVLIHKIYGFRISIEDDISRVFDTISQENMREIVKIMEFSDFRDSAMEFYGNDFDNCLAPWVYGWSGVISISKTLFIESGLFDEKFKGWGSEDTDLAYRLWLNKGKFIYEGDAFGVHMAHKIINMNKDNQNYVNRQYLYSKYKTLETELYTYFSGVSINNVLSICQTIHLGALNPIYTSDQIAIINGIINNQKAICLGLDSYQEISRLDFTSYLTLNSNTEKIIKNNKKKVDYSRRLGIMTDYINNYFDVCIIFDSYNYLPQNLYNCVIQEMNRISKKVIQLKTRNFKPSISIETDVVENQNEDKLITITL